MPRKQRGYGGGADNAPRPQTPDSQRRSAAQPMRAPTGMPQGERKATIDSQRAVPLPDNQARMQAAITAAGPMGGQSLLAPTARPDEPPTAGIPLGPGPGPSAITPPMAPVTSDDTTIAKYLPMLEALADQPDATRAVRNYVRRLRGQLNPNVTMETLLDGLS